MATGNEEKEDLAVDPLQGILVEVDGDISVKWFVHPGHQLVLQVVQPVRLVSAAQRHVMVTYQSSSFNPYYKYYYFSSFHPQLSEKLCSVLISIDEQV